MTSSKVAGSGSVSPAAVLVGTTNTRVIPAFPAVADRHVKMDTLYRGDVLGAAGSRADSTWDPQNADVYRSLGLRLVIDLRSDAEADLIPSAWDQTGAELVRAPIPEGVEGTETDFIKLLRSGEITRFSPQDLGGWYRDVFERRANVFGFAIGRLAAEGGLPALIHCHAGKDRTGLLIALVLEVVGVPRELVIQDYALTDGYRGHIAEGHLKPFVSTLGLDPDDVRAFWQSPSTALEIALESLDRDYGGPEKYLVSAGGVVTEQLDWLRATLLE